MSLSPRTRARGISPGLTLLLAIACGTSVANLYYAQPLLSTIAHSFRSGSGRAGLIVTLGQIGYALGRAFLVPAGDLVSRRRLVPIALLISAAALVCYFAGGAVGSAVAGSFYASDGWAAVCILVAALGAGATIFGDFDGVRPVTPAAPCNSPEAAPAR